MRKSLQRFAVSFCILFLLQEVHPLIVIPRVENEHKNVEEKRIRRDAPTQGDSNKEVTGVATHSRKKSKFFYSVFYKFACCHGIYT